MLPRQYLYVLPNESVRFILHGALTICLRTSTAHRVFGYPPILTIETTGSINIEIVVDDYVAKQITRV